MCGVVDANHILLTFDKSWKFFLRQVIWLGAIIYRLYTAVSCPVPVRGMKCSWHSTVFDIEYGSVGLGPALPITCWYWNELIVLVIFLSWGNRRAHVTQTAREMWTGLIRPVNKNCRTTDRPLTIVLPTDTEWNGEELQIADVNRIVPRTDIDQCLPIGTGLLLLLLFFKFLNPHKNEYWLLLLLLLLLKMIRLESSSSSSSSCSFIKNNDKMHCNNRYKRWMIC